MKSNDIEKNLQANLLEQSTYQNGYSAYVPWSKSIGFKVHSMRLQEQAVNSHLAKDFLANLGFTRNDMESEYSIRSFLEPTGTVMLSLTHKEDNNHLEKVSLPASVPLKMALDVVMKARRSIRHYTGDKVPLVYLATILRSACGITSSNEMDLNNGSSATLNFRSSASAGGIYPTDLYIVALNVEKLDRAIYQYNPTEDCLVKLFNKEAVENLLNAFSITEDQISIQRSGFICLLTGSAAKSMHKYGSQGLSFTLQEVGSISQNIHLAVTALGMGSVDCASFYLNEVHYALNMDGIYKHLFHTIIVGISQ
jgi:SagB-type dehydrogenase family enzyme